MKKSPQPLPPKNPMKQPWTHRRQTLQSLIPKNKSIYNSCMVIFFSTGINLEITLDARFFSLSLLSKRPKKTGEGPPFLGKGSPDFTGDSHRFP